MNSEYYIVMYFVMSSYLESYIYAENISHFLSPKSELKLFYYDNSNNIGQFSMVMCYLFLTKCSMQSQHFGQIMQNHFSGINPSISHWILVYLVVK